MSAAPAFQLRYRESTRDQPRDFGKGLHEVMQYKKPRTDFVCTQCGKSIHGWAYKVKDFIQPDADRVYEICTPCWLMPRVPPMPPLRGQLHLFRMLPRPQASSY